MWGRGGGGGGGLGGGGGRGFLGGGGGGGGVEGRVREEMGEIVKRLRVSTAVKGKRGLSECGLT